ncbi:MAG: M48 family metalloprotease [Thermoplasmata archaeon]
MDGSGNALAFDPERQALARRRLRESLVWGFFGITVSMLGVFLTLPTGLSLRLEAWALSLTTHPWGVVAVYVVVGYLVLAVLALPLRVVGRRSELKYGLTRQSWPSWALDRLKSTVLGLLFALLAIEVLYWTIRNFGEVWWVVLWILSIGFSLLAGFLGPVFLLPLFYRVAELKDPGLRDRLQDLSARAGVRAIGVYEFRSSAKTERGTAAVAGLGRTRRILLSDHISREYAGEEVEGILAHELAHHANRDVARSLLVSALLSLLLLLVLDRLVRGTMGAYGIASLDQVANLPLFILFGGLFYTLTAPLSRALSRRREALADRRGAELSGHPTGMARALIKLHDQNLGLADPHPWIERLFYSHPSGRRRVRRLLARQRGAGDA